MIEIEIHKPFERMEPSLDDCILATDFQGSIECFRYEELCSRYNRLLEEVRYLTSLNSAITRERDGYAEQAAKLEEALRETDDK